MNADRGWSKSVFIQIYETQLHFVYLINEYMYIQRAIQVFFLWSESVLTFFFDKFGIERRLTRNIKSNFTPDIQMRNN